MTSTDEKPRQIAPRRTGRAPNRRYVIGSGGGATPYMLNDAGLALVQRLAREGLPLISIAEAVGLAKDTFIDLRRRQPEAQEAIDRGRSRVVGELTNVLLTKAHHPVSPLFFATGTKMWGGMWGDFVLFLYPFIQAETES